MIKKICVSFVVLIAVSSIFAFAAGKTTYYIPECDISVDFPDDYFVFYKDMDDNDPALDYFGLSKSEALDVLDSRGAYFDAFDLSGSFEIYVLLTDTGEDEYDMNDFSDSDLLSSFGVDSLNAATDTVSFSNVEIYNPSQIKYVKARGTHNYNGTECGFVEYLTFCSHYLITFSAKCYDGELNSAQESIIRNIVDSVCFGERPMGEPYLENQGELHYTDTETGLTFTVPEYWTEDIIDASTEDLVAKFHSSKDLDSFIMYGRIIHNDPSSDNSVYTVEMIADTLGISSDQVRILEYGGKEYRGGPASTVIDIEGEEYTVETLYLIHDENGCLYYFHFVGDEASEQFSDFESVLNSVKYPGDTTGSQVVNEEESTESNHTSNSDTKQPHSTVIVLVCIGLVALIGVFAAVLLRRKRSKDSSLKENADYTMPSAVKEKNEQTVVDSAEQTRLFCYNCGAPLRSDSRFCEQCGAKIENEQH